MCGIAGIFSLDGKTPDQGRLQRMAHHLSHRGPDDQGTWISPTSSIGMAHTRLSILDPTPAGHQPYHLEDGRYSLTYNGEIYNFLELRSELQDRGVVFHTDCDTEVLLRAYQHWGANCLEKFNGMWAFALWDELRQQLFCSRDRFGVKPFYYTVREGEFRWASEPKALVLDDPNLRQLNPRAVARFFTEGLLDDEEETFYRDIFPLPAAHYIVVSKDSSPRKLRFWSISQRQGLTSAIETAAERLSHSPSFSQIRVRPLQFDAGPSELLLPAQNKEDWFTAVEAFRSLMVDSVRLRLRSDVPVGTCLSGGLDSTTIVSIASNLISHPMKSFSSIYRNRGCDEERFIEAAVAGAGCDSFRVFPDPHDLVEHFDPLAYHQDEPSAGPGLFSQWMVMRKAQGQVKVLLDGQGGDELLAGYHPYFEDGLYTRVGQASFSEVQEEAAAAQSLTGKDYSKVLRDARNHFRLPAFLRNFKKPRPGKIKPTDFMSSDFCRLYREVDPRRAAPSELFGEKLNDRLYHDVTRTSIPCLLRYEDRSSMAFGLEARTPFLDYRLVEFAFAMPVVYKIYRDQTKRILRRSMAGLIPRPVLERQDKMGYPTPACEWFRGALKEWAQERLAGPGLVESQCFSLPQVQKLWQSHLDGQDRTWEIWRFLSFESWFRQFMLR